MSIAKIQKGDKVKVMTGDHKGTIGQVVKISKQIKNNRQVIRAAVSTVPKQTKYRRGNKAYNFPGQMYQIDKLINISNLSLVTDKDVPSKIKIEVSKEGKKKRAFKKNSKEVVKESNEKGSENLTKESSKKVKNKSDK
jgi:large subunit ribosomal protein L24